MTYPSLKGSNVAGLLTKTLPNFTGILELQYGTNHTLGSHEVLLDGKVIDVAGANEISKTVTVSFTPLQKLVIRETVSSILAIYSLKISSTVSRALRLIGGGIEAFLCSTRHEVGGAGE